MKYFLFVCSLLALSRVALADEAFPAFVTGQGATGSITGSEFMPVIQNGVTTKDTLSGLKTYFQAGGSSGTVTSVGTTAPLSGGPITSAGTVALTGPSNLTSFTATAIPKGNGSFPFVASSLTDDGTTVLTTEQVSVGGVKAADQAGSGVRCIHVDNTGKQSVASGDCATGGSGSVTSIGISVPATSIFGVTGSPVTTSGTIGVTTTGSSGGVPYFSSSSQLASSAALGANLPVIGGGGGGAPSTGTKSGNTTAFVTTTGAQTSGNAVTIDANGNHIASGSVLPVAANPTATIGTSAINGSATTFMRSDAAPPIPLCSASTAGACKPDGSTITATAGVLTASASGVPNIKVLSPIGGDNAPQIQTALAGNQTVELSPGYYEVCSQIEVARYTTLFGVDGARQGIGNASPGYPYSLQATVIGSNGCPNSGNGTFAAADQGFLHLHDNTTVYGFAIQGQRQIGGHRLINCINAENAAAITVTAMTLVDCYYGVDRRSSATPGDSGSISQTAIIAFNTIPYVEQAGIICGTRDGGNGCADERYSDNWIDVDFVDGIFIDGGIQFQIINNRIEDGSSAFHLQNAGFGIISNNLINRQVALNITSTNGAGLTSISYTGNKMSCIEPAGTQAAISLGDFMYNVLITGNMFSYNCSSAYQWITPGLMEGSLITNNIYGVVPVVPSINGDTLAHMVQSFPGVVPTFKGNSADASTDFLGVVGGTDVAFIGWAAVAPNATLTTRSVIDPTGMQMGAKLTELATTASHAMSSNGTTLALISGNTYTMMALFAPGTSGTRNVALSEDDGTNSVRATFNPSTCAFVASAAAGTGTVVGTPSAVSIGGGWCRGAVSFTGVGTSNRLIYLMSGSTVSYAGDGTSNVSVYGVSVVESQVSPGAVVFRP